MLAASLALPVHAVSTSARADEPPKKTPNQQKAEQHYKRARELYQLGRYREAITHLELAIKLDPSGAELYYNLGLVHEKLGDIDEAVDAYRRYLKILGPDAEKEEIDRIKVIIKRLEGAKAEVKAREAKLVEHRFTPLSLGLLIGSGVCAVGLTVSGLLAIKHDRDARAYSVDGVDGLVARQKQIKSSKNEAIAADIFAGVGLAALGAGLTLYFTSEFQKADDPNHLPAPKTSVSLLPLCSGAALRVQVPF